MAFLRTCAALLPLLIAGSCVPDPTSVPAGEHLIVHAVLVAGSDSARVLVVRSGAQRFDEFGSHLSLLEPVTNARVRIVHANDTTTLGSSVACLRPSNIGPMQPATPGGCYTAALPGGVRADEHYELLVDAAGHPSVSGSTRVPAAPVVAHPSAGTELGFREQGSRDVAEYFTARWSISGEGDLTDLRFVSAIRGCFIPVGQPQFDLFGLDRILVAGTDTVTLAPFAVNCEGVSAGDRHEAALAVTFYDASYSAYISRNPQGQGIRFMDAAIGVTGGFGVFGAAATTLVPVTLVKR